MRREKFVDGVDAVIRQGCPISAFRREGNGGHLPQFPLKVGGNFSRGKGGRGRARRHGGPRHLLSIQRALFIFCIF